MIAGSVFPRLECFKTLCIRSTFLCFFSGKVFLKQTHKMGLLGRIRIGPGLRIIVYNARAPKTKCGVGLGSKVQIDLGLLANHSCARRQADV
jgi:hypothetical protein